VGDASRRLAAAVWTDIPPGTTLLIPLGSTEQHGPHLPLDTDARIAEAVASRAAASRVDLWVAPVLSYGSSGEHDGFRGTLSIGTDVLRSVLVELVRSASLSFAAMIFVNGHGGNVEAVRSAVAQMRSEGHRVAQWSPRVPNADAHAGRTETSLMLAIDQSAVRLNLAAAGATASLSELMPVMRTGGVIAVSENGVLGDPTGATATEGAALLDQLVDDLLSAVDVVE